mgnify:CR=1 FL=1
MNAPTDLQTPLHATPARSLSVEPFTFSGRGGEYFRIWIVNLLLSIVTLGIYSAWAKVRRMKYFYGNTQVAGSSFEYHGNPIAILKGRLIAAALFISYNFTISFAPMLGVAIFVLLILAMPWFVWKSQQFKLYNSSYRGIRFGFAGSAGKAYFVYLLLPILTALSVYLLAPLMHQKMKKFQHEESRFGQTHFSFDAKVGSFYKTYLLGLVIAIAGIALITMLFGASAGLLTALTAPQTASPELMTSLFGYLISLYVFLFLMFPLLFTMIQNLIWNHTKLGEHRFSLDLKWLKVAGIMITNLLAIACTLGLFTPFAQIRMMKYRLESMSLHAAGNLDEFIADTQQHVSATGEGMADILDFDLSL